ALRRVQRQHSAVVLEQGHHCAGLALRQCFLVLFGPLKQEPLVELFVQLVLCTRRGEILKEQLFVLLIDVILNLEDKLNTPLDWYCVAVCVAEEDQQAEGQRALGVFRLGSDDDLAQLSRDGAITSNETIEPALEKERTFLHQSLRDQVDVLIPLLKAGV